MVTDFIKKYRTLLVVCAVLVIGVAVTAVILSGGNGEVTSPDRLIATYIPADGKAVSTVFDSADYGYKAPEIGGSLKVTNTKQTEAVIYIDSGSEISERKIGQGETVIGLSDYSTPVSVSFLIDGSYYISSFGAFEKVTGDESVTGKTVVMISDLSDSEKENTEFLYPFRWQTNGHKFTTSASLVFSSSKDGEMIIENDKSDDIICGGVRCKTPLWDYRITDIFSDFSENGYCYINAKTVNEKPVDKTALYIDTPEKLDYVTDDGKLILADGTASVNITGKLPLGKLIVTEPVVLTVSGEVSVSDMILFETEKSGTITVDTTKNSVPLGEKISFGAENTDIIWKGTDSISPEAAEKYMSYRSYNGMKADINLGGIGENRVASGSIGGFTVSVDGKYLEIITRYTDKLDLSDAEFNITLEKDGEFSVIEDGGDYYVKVLDKNGAAFGYKVNTVRDNYNLPVISITTDDGEEVYMRNEYVTGGFSIDYNGYGDYADITDVDVNIRLRGNSSLKLPKSPYKIKFDKKTSLFGLEKNKEWVLLANHVDRTLMRNTVAMNMAAHLDNMLFIPSSHLVDLFVNGEYVGVYSISEQIEIKDGRLPGESDSSEIDADYLLEIGGDNIPTYFGTNLFLTSFKYHIEIKDPDYDVVSEEQFNYIENYFKETDEAIRNLSGYEEYIDVDSLIDWFILNEFSYNVDGTFRRSGFMMKLKGDKLYWASPWDYDYAFGNFIMDGHGYKEWICLGNAYTDGYVDEYGDPYIKENWMDYLLTDKNFTDKLKARWEEVGEALYDTAVSTIDESERFIGISAEDNFTVWENCFGVSIQFEPYRVIELRNYEEHLEYLREFIDNRYAWMDETIGNM